MTSELGERLAHRTTVLSVRLDVMAVQETVVVSPAMLEAGAAYDADFEAGT